MKPVAGGALARADRPAFLHSGEEEHPHERRADAALRVGDGLRERQHLAVPDGVSPDNLALALGEGSKGPPFDYLVSLRLKRAGYSGKRSRSRSIRAGLSLWLPPRRRPLSCGRGERRKTPRSGLALGVLVIGRRFGEGYPVASAGSDRGLDLAQLVGTGHGDASKQKT